MPSKLTVKDWAAIGERAIVYNLGPIEIGEATTVSQHAHLCAGTHDYRQADFPLVKAPITIGKGVWICADAFVGPGVTVGDRAILGARAVLMQDLAADQIAAGNPARVIKTRPAPAVNNATAADADQQSKT